MAVQTPAQALPGMQISWRQLGALAGFLGVIGFVVGIGVTGDAPTIKDSIDSTRSFYEDNGSTYLTGNFIIALSMVLGLLPFLIVLRQVMVEADEANQVWSQIALISGIFMLIFGAAASSFCAAMAVDVQQLDDSALGGLQYLNFYTFAISPIIFVPFMLSVAMVSLRRGVFWTWLAWLALALAVVSVVAAGNSISGDPDDVLGTLGFIAWIGFGVTVLAMSVGMWMHRESA